MENKPSNNKPLQPIILSISNKTGKTQRARAFFPNAKSEDNYGNEYGIILKTTVGGYDVLTGEKAENKIGNDSYDCLLSAMNKKTIVVNLVYLQAIAVSNNPFQPYTIHTDNVLDGSYNGKIITPFLEPYQNQSGVSVKRGIFGLHNINGSSGFIFTMLPNSEMYVFLFPEAILDVAMSEEEIKEKYKQEKQYDIFGSVINNSTTQGKSVTVVPASKKATRKKTTAKKAAPKKSTSATSSKK